MPKCVLLSFQDCKIGSLLKKIIIPFPSLTETSWWDLAVRNLWIEGDLGQMTRSGWQSVADRGAADGGGHLHNWDKSWAGGVTIGQDSGAGAGGIEMRKQLLPGGGFILLLECCHQNNPPDHPSQQSRDTGTVLPASPQDTSVGCD